MGCRHLSVMVHVGELEKGYPVEAQKAEGWNSTSIHLENADCSKNMAMAQPLYSCQY